MRHSLKALEKVAEARFLAEKAKWSAVFQEDARICAALAKIEAQAQENERTMITGRDAKTLAAGPVWQGWAATKKIALQTQAARNAVEKSRAVDSLSKAFGRKYAVALLRDAEKKLTVRKKNRQ